MMQEIIARVVGGADLSREAAESVMQYIMDGNATDAQIGAFLTALHMKGETIEEIVAFARVMRSHAVQISPAKSRMRVDTCGTGGDGKQTVNISTAAAFVAAAAGVCVVKHGNRSASGSCGSADILEALGVRIEIPPKRVEEIISDIGIGFLFAPVYHPAMKHVARARREIGFRSIFNLLGPLLNPAGATAQLLGVYARELCLPLAHVLADLGLSHAMVVHGEGLDEITTTGITTVAELKDGIVTSYTLDSRDLGFLPADETTLAGGSPEKNAAIIRSVFSGKPGPVYDIVALNAGAAIYLAGGSADLGAGVTEALIALQSGAAERKLDQLIRATGQAS